MNSGRFDSGYFGWWMDLPFNFAKIVVLIRDVNMGQKPAGPYGF